ncbi:unnamed protein product [Musa acuminata subsp. burmannicoides]
MQPQCFRILIAPYCLVHGAMKLSTVLLAEYTCHGSARLVFVRRQSFVDNFREH